MMKNKRLQAILSFLDIPDSFIDIGCDHAYIPIEMARLGCQRILATDISEGALAIAKKNIVDSGLEDIISTCLSDGLEKVDTTMYDTLVLAGMGTSTIQHILHTPKIQNIKKIIVQSNNDLKDLRMFLNTLGYALEEEKVVLEKKHYYVVMKYVKGKQTLKKVEYEYGLYNKDNQPYYEYLFNTLDEIYEKIPENHYEERRENRRKKELLQSYL